MLVKFLIFLPFFLAALYILLRFYKSRRVFLNGERTQAKVVALQRVERIGESPARNKTRNEYYIILEYTAYDGERISAKSMYTVVGRFIPSIGAQVDICYLREDRQNVLAMMNYRSYTFYLQLLVMLIFLGVAAWFVFFQLEF